MRLWSERDCARIMTRGSADGALPQPGGEINRRPARVAGRRRRGMLDGARPWPTVTDRGRVVREDTERFRRSRVRSPHPGPYDGNCFDGVCPGWFMSEYVGGDADRESDQPLRHLPRPSQDLPAFCDPVLAGWLCVRSAHGRAVATLRGVHMFRS
jgi:hypothetical protein